LEIKLSQLKKIKIISETRLDHILEACRIVNPSVLVMDSIQTVFDQSSTSSAGSVNQIRDCAARLTSWAKSTGNSLFLIGHVNKEGNLAGPRVLEHMVDAVIYFEGDSGARFRIVRSVKNRFGAINEIGVFSMSAKGLKEVTNPSALFLTDSTFSEKESNKKIEFRPGTCVFASQEATRPMLLEIQALVDKNHTNNPRRFCLGLDSQRLPMLLAVLQRHCQISCFDQDVYVNAVGGLKITEPSADLSILLSIISSIRSKSLPDGLVAFGEIGLSGEIRPSSKGIDRLKESAKLGFIQAIIPKANVPKQKISNLKITGINQISDVLDLL
jgi:DNA repair protein RadA/Sms